MTMVTFFHKKITSSTISQQGGFHDWFFQDSFIINNISVGSFARLRLGSL
jgi:hypothetical protein